MHKTNITKNLKSLSTSDTSIDHRCLLFPGEDSFTFALRLDLSNMQRGFTLSSITCDRYSTNELQ